MNIIKCFYKYLKNGTCASVATALANRVFPHPGGPRRSAPRGTCNMVNNFGLGIFYDVPALIFDFANRFFLRKITEKFLSCKLREQELPKPQNQVLLFFEDFVTDFFWFKLNFLYFKLDVPNFSTILIKIYKKKKKFADAKYLYLENERCPKIRPLKRAIHN